MERPSGIPQNCRENNWTPNLIKSIYLTTTIKEIREEKTDIKDTWGTVSWIQSVGNSTGQRTQFLQTANDMGKGKGDMS